MRILPSNSKAKWDPKTELNQHWPWYTAATSVLGEVFSCELEDDIFPTCLAPYPSKYDGLETSKV
jgi:hypothetical protein